VAQLGEWARVFRENGEICDAGSSTEDSVPGHAAAKGDGEPCGHWRAHCFLRLCVRRFTSSRPLRFDASFRGDACHLVLSSRAYLHTTDVMRGTRPRHVRALRARAIVSAMCRLRRGDAGLADRRGPEIPRTSTTTHGPASGGFREVNRSREA